MGSVCQGADELQMPLYRGVVAQTVLLEKYIVEALDLGLKVLQHQDHLDQAGLRLGC
jgi:hypothetical protein